jgi:hypothetical protein
MAELRIPDFSGDREKGGTGMVKKALICLAVMFLMSALPALAQNIQVSGTPLQAHSDERVVATAELPPPRDPILYNSFGANALAAYSVANGWLILGPANALNATEQDIAVNFACLLAACHVRTVYLPIQWNGAGTKNFQVSICADNGLGVPGAVCSVVKAFNGIRPAIPNFPACCTTTKVDFPAPGVAIAAGVFYWVVVNTPAGATTQDVWNFSNNTFAYQLTPPGGWANGASATGIALAAMEVEGTIP